MIQNTKDIEFQQKSGYWGEVVWVDGDFESGTIKVRVAELDKNIADGDLAPCYPLSNFQFFRIYPKLGERVAITLDRTYSGERTINQEKRYWSCVGISQPHNIDYDPYYYTASSAESDGFVKPKDINALPGAVGVNPKLDEIAIRGRKNTDILLKDNQITMRAGRHLAGDPLSFNELDPAFVQVRYKEKPGKSTRTKISERLQDIPSRFIIKTTVSGTSLLIKTIDKNSAEAIETYSKTYPNRDGMIADARAKILELQSRYDFWELRTALDELQDMPVLFPNNKRIVKTLEIVKSDRDFEVPSTVNIVADHINLLSHKTNDADLTDPLEVISKETQETINSTSYRMAKGELLVDVLRLVRAVLNNHVHPYPNMSAVQDDLLRKLNNYNLESILNDFIRLK